nr:hypothetical protein [Planosporangium thailandense]
MPAALPVPSEPDPTADPVGGGPVPDAARADAGRHYEPSGGNTYEPSGGNTFEPSGGEPSDRPADQREWRGTAASGRHYGERPAQRSPWAPASLPPGYERIPTARVAPPTEYEEVSAYREPGGGYGSAAEPAAAGEQSARLDPPWRATDSPWPEPHWSEPRWSEPSRAGDTPGWTERTAEAAPHRALLPQRVPAAPDVPGVSGAPGIEPEGGLPAAAPELARIASYLRDEDDDGQVAQPDGFDIPAVLAAVRIVPGVRDAHVRTNASGAQTLRLELADDADPGEVSRAVTRLLNERMGLAAEPNDGLEAPVPAYSDPLSAPSDPTSAYSDPLSAYSDLASAPTVPGRRRAVEDDDLLDRPGRPSTRSDDAGRHDGADERRPGEPSMTDEDRSKVDPLSTDSASATDSLQVDEPAAGRRRARLAETQGIERGVTEYRALGSRGTRSRVAESVSGAAYQPGTDVGRTDPGRAEPGRAEPGREVAAPAHRPLRGASGVARVILDRVEVSTQGTDAVVEVRLSAAAAAAVGVAQGPAFDGYVLRVAAVAAANAIDDLLTGSDGVPAARCLIENATVVPMGGCEVAVVVLLLAHNGWAEQLSGAAVVDGDQRHAVVRATLAAVNRRLEALLP